MGDSRKGREEEGKERRGWRREKKEPQPGPTLHQASRRMKKSAKGRRREERKSGGSGRDGEARAARPSLHYAMASDPSEGVVMARKTLIDAASIEWRRES